MKQCIFLLQKETTKHLLKMRLKYDAEKFWHIFKCAFFEIDHANTGQARKACTRSTSHNTKHQKKEKTKLACWNIRIWSSNIRKSQDIRCEANLLYNYILDYSDLKFCQENCPLPTLYNWKKNYKNYHSPCAANNDNNIAFFLLIHVNIKNKR